MIKLSIPKGKRRNFLTIPLPFFTRKKAFTITKRFLFTDSAIYSFPDEDQHDINKLFGFSIGLHHHNSFRFGWRPNNYLNKIEIVGYEYHNKVRITSIPLCDVELNKWYKYEMKYFPKENMIEYVVSQEFDKYCVCINQSYMILPRWLNWGYTLGLYFGGNKKAPHTITILRK